MDANEEPNCSFSFNKSIQSNHTILGTLNEQKEGGDGDAINYQQQQNMMHTFFPKSQNKDNAASVSFDSSNDLLRNNRDRNQNLPTLPINNNPDQSIKVQSNDVLFNPTMNGTRKRSQIMSGIPTIFDDQQAKKKKVPATDTIQLPILNLQDSTPKNDGGVLNLANMAKPRRQSQASQLPEIEQEDKPKLNMASNPFAALTGNLNNSNATGTSATALMLKQGTKKSTVFNMAGGGNANNKMVLMLKDKMQTKIQEQNRKKCMIYPNNALKSNWDMVVTMVLIFTCMVTPYRIAFVEHDDDFWQTINIAIDLLFLGDMILSFISAFYTDEFELVEDRKQIAWEYGKSWFVIDFLAIFPFDKMQGTTTGVNDLTTSNDMVRLVKLGRLYKVLRLIKLVRLLKLGKSQNNFFAQVKAVLQISVAFERVVMFMIIFFMICHIVACLWIIIAGFETGDPNSWLSEEYKKMSSGEQYLTSVYFTVTTITTVGYGDISGGTFGEKIAAIILMLLGVISFSVASASLSSIFSSFDNNEEAILKEKLQLLRKLQAEYNLPLKLCSDIVKNLRSGFSRDKDDKSIFVEELPHNLRNEICIHMYQNIYKTVDFLKSKPTLFLSWICPILRKTKTIKGEYVYHEGDDVKCIYFNTSASLSFCLPKYSSVDFVKIGSSSTFGISDIIGSMIDYFAVNAIESPKLDLWSYNQKILRRLFTVLSHEDNEIFILTLEDLDMMEQEFRDYYDELFESGLVRLQKLNAVREDSLKKCAKQQFQWLQQSQGNNQQSLVYQLKAYQLVTLDKMDVNILFKTLENQPKNHLQELIEKYMYLENGIESVQEEPAENELLDNQLQNSFETERDDKDKNVQSQPNMQIKGNKRLSMFAGDNALYKNSIQSEDGKILEDQQSRGMQNEESTNPVQIQSMVQAMFQKMQHDFFEKMQETQNRQQEEMNRNLMELRKKNEHFETLIKDLQQEVRGYKDAVSEHTGSNNG